MAEPRHSLATIQRALDHIPADCGRDTWLRALAALKSECGDTGLELARQWSERGVSFKPADFASTWRSLTPDGGITIGTLFALAKENGFTFDRKRDNLTKTAPPRRTADEAARDEAMRRTRRQEEAAAKVAALYEAAGTTGHSPYLERKGIGAHGVRFGDDGVLLVPMRNAGGELRSVQWIAADGTKRYAAGAQKSDLLHWLGDPTGAPTCALAEGYATAASIHEATGLPVACAFDAGNLSHVAFIVRKQRPEALLIICADDDAATAGRVGKNPGLAAAREAARVGNAIVALPAPLEAGETDFNDLARRAGPAAVAAIIETAIARRAEQPSAAASPTSSDNVAGDDDPFEVTERGVYFRSRDKDGRTSGQFVCPPLSVEARTRDVEGSSWGYLLVFADPDGTTKRLAVPARHFAGDGTDLRKLLYDEGLNIAHSPARNRVPHYITSRRPSRRVLCVETVGWHGDAFVLPQKSYGASAGELFYQTADERPRNTYKAAGTLEGWRDDVASRCVGNARLVFLVALAFAGPCVHLAGAQSGGFNFYGASSKGKTTALAVGAGVYGRPTVVDGGFIQTWRATGNALEATAAAHCDATLFLDEISQAEPKEIVSTVLMLGNGAGKARMRAGGAPRPRHTWRLLFASTGERRIEELAALAGVPVDAGAGVRLVEIPTPDAGAFEDLHGESDGSAFADRLRSMALAHYGVAGDAWLEWLTAHRDEAQAFVLELVRKLCERWIVHTTDAGQTKRVAARFALVAAAGELATRAGITGWKKGEAALSAKLLFDDWLGARGTRGDAEELAALRQVAALLGQHAESYFPWWHRAVDDHRPNAPKRWGLRKLNDSGVDVHAEEQHDLMLKDGRATESTTTFYVTASAFRDELCNGFDPRYVARVLHQRNYLLADSDGEHLSRKERLPGIGPTRCYVIKPELFEDDKL